MRPIIPFIKSKKNASQLAELATQVGEGGGGGGTVKVDSVSSLQSLYPDGLSVPVWVSSENTWYYWSGVVAPPADTTAPVLTITPTATFTTTQTVTMSTNETATIYYTLDDSDPKSSGTKLTYSSPLTLTETDTIKAYARDTAGNESAVQTVTYTKQASAPSAGTIVTSDTFSGSSLGTPDTGQAWTTQSGSFVVSGGVVSGNTSFGDRAVSESGIYDCEISLDLVKLNLTGSTAGVVLRSSDAANYLLVEVDQSGGGTIKIQKFVSNVKTVLSTGTKAYVVNKPFKVVAQGSNIKAYYDNVLVAEATDSFNQTATKHGFSFWNSQAGSQIDNFKIMTV